MPPQEFELKFEVPVKYTEKLEHLPFLKAVKPARIETLRSVYFDTEKQKLRKNGFSLRVRTEHGQHKQTIKQGETESAGVFDRHEWETDIAGHNLDIDAAKNSGLKRLLRSKKLIRNLKPLIETQVRRKVFSVRRRGAAIELAVDTGTVKAARKTGPLCEVELELKEGDPAELFKLAHELGDTVPVMPATRSNAGRGYDLIDDKGAGAIRAEPVSLTPDADWAAAFRIIARACLFQIAANGAGICRRDAEALHQMRVGLRQLRATISLFKEMLAGVQTEAMKAELKWLTGELGPARELDVFMRRVARRSETRNSADTGRAAVVGDFGRRRARAFERADEAVGSLRFRRLLLDLMIWIEIGDWGSKRGEPAQRARERSVDDAAAKELQRRYKKIRKQGAALAKLGARARHRLRIKAKKLRYACEFFAGAFAGKKSATRREKLVARLKALQDALGDLNDIRVNEGLTESAIKSQDFRKHGKRTAKAFAAGKLSGRESARLDRAMQTARKNQQKFAKAKPFWS